MHVARSEILRFASLAPGERGPACLQALRDRPRCPIANYLSGCWLFDTGQPARAVRCLMTAHHAAPPLESAALLVFAGLNLVSDPGAPLLDVLLRTWDQFRRPAFDRSPLERALLDAFAADDGPLRDRSGLTRRLWRLPLNTVRHQLRESAAAAEPSGVYPRLLLAGA